MAASYPSSVKVFTTKATNDTIEAAHVNDLQDEVSAVETGLLNGLAHTLFPLTDNTYDLGTSAKAIKDLYFKGTLKLAGQTIVFDNRINDFRLTLTSGTPVTTADVTGATTVYCAPLAGNRIALYDGSAQWNVRTSTEFSIALGTLTNDLPYDVFCYDNSGVPTLEILAWSSKTARATALTTQDGVLVKSGATTRRYLGTFHTTATTTTEDSFAKRLLWNYYNRVPRPLRVVDTTDTWTYTTATLREANAGGAGAGVNRLAVVVGWNEVPIEVQVFAQASCSVAGNSLAAGIGEDSTSAMAAGTLSRIVSGPVGTYRTAVDASLKKFPAVGYHFYCWLEYATTGGTVTWYGDDNNASPSQSGIHGTIHG